MFKTIEDLKAFVLWAKKEQVASFKAGDIEVVISPYALIEPQSNLQAPATGAEAQELKPESEDEALYWSTR